MDHKEKFFNVMENIFIGAKIEGTGGFVNLMKIKTKYYKKIKELILEDINKLLSKYPTFEEELYDKLYTFFSRYFSENGSIYFNSTIFHNNIYEKVYENDKDISLFWKTKMLYYIKTDKIFKSMLIEDKYYFNAETIELKKTNEKKDLVYKFKEIKDGKIIFDVFYSKNGEKTNYEELTKKLKINEEELERIFRIFEKQNEVDFYLHKNAKQFLQEQFKLWLYNYIWENNFSFLTVDRVRELEILRNIAYKIIDFVGQFEDELVKIWNKPKFVKNSNYVITLNKITNNEIIQKILNHPNLEQQIQEWKDLKIVDNNFNKNDILKFEYRFLPVDTKYFKDLELEILSLFDNLDEVLDGWLIKSENYQALNTILPKFNNKVQTIYIDPPFNLDSSDQFMYRTNYKDANWATLLENRLEIAKKILNDKGSIFVRCDYNGNWIVRCLMNDIFGKENFKNEIIIAKSKGFFKVMTHIKKLVEEVESLFWYSKTEDYKFKLLYIDKKEEKICKPFLPANKGPDYTEKRIIQGKEYWSPKGLKWGFKQDKVEEYIKSGKLIFQNGEWMLKYTEEPIKNLWNDYQGYSKNWDFNTENSEIFIKRVLQLTTEKNDLILDFFLGSGTTTSVAHKLGRKWIGVEMGEHFYNVVLPRMKKVLFYDDSGISKDKDVKENYNKDNAGGFFKYYELEQYEEVLNNCVYEDTEYFNENVFLKDEKLLKVFDGENIDLTKLYDNIDIAETLSNLKGKYIKKIYHDKVEFIDGDIIDIKNLDYKAIKPLIWWE